MTHREMTAEELESILAAMRRIGMRTETKALLAHIAALRVRADSAVSAMADVTEAVLGERPVGVMRETTLEAAQALRARVETAEADNADALDRLEACRATMEVWGFGDYGHGTPERHAYEVCHFPAGTKHPGTGYRAKVRAELLRELADVHSRLASTPGLETLLAKMHASLTTRLREQAAREEQG